MAALSYAEKARLSNYEIDNDGNLIVKNAWMLWRNFAGNPAKNYGGKDNHRGFALLLDEPVARDLMERGWNVRERMARDESEENYFITDVIVNPACKFPPKITLYTEFNGEVHEKEFDLRDADDIDALADFDEKIRIKRADLVVSLAKTGGRYLQELNVVERPQRSFFGSDYDPTRD